MKKKLDSTPGVALRIALLQRGLRYCDVIQLANERLPADVWLTETALSKIITGRQRVKPEQAEALSAVLDCPVEEIFPNIGKESSSVRKAEAGEA
ncbi:MAG: hypothetical protein H8E62_03700 [Planctomycetes bacterium]|nr:hypothetical protein [Planctomycetota bacterium]